VFVVGVGVNIDADGG